MITPATVVGINFGNSYASIAVITKEGTAECIANEDGERQIAAAIAFHGEEMYIGNQAPPQLVKNAENTVIGFRNLLGKRFSEIPQSQLDASTTSARIIQHPTLEDTPCYAVRVLVPSPSPLPPSSRATPTPTPSRTSTQHPTPVPTPRSEAVPQTRHITPHDATVLFLKSLHTSAAEYLGKTPDGAVLSVPMWFDKGARDALREAAKEAGVCVLALLDEHAAAAAVLVNGDTRDRTTLVVDWGATDLAATLLTTRAGLVHVLAHTRASELGTARAGGVDEVLVRHFAKEFTKKTGEVLQMFPSTLHSARAQSKLLLALPHVKRSLTTVPSVGSQKLSSSTQISIESLHAGLDFSASLNRTRALGLLGPVFNRVVTVMRGLFESCDKCGARGEWIDSVMWVGGAGRLGALGGTDALLGAGLLTEDVVDATVDVGAPEEVVARGCAMYATACAGTSKEDVAALNVPVTRRTVGVIAPEAVVAAAAMNGDARPAVGDEEELGGQWIPVIRAETPLPARRTVRFSLAESKGHGRAAFEVWEVSEVIRVRKVAGSGVHEDGENADEEDEADEEQEEEERERGVRKERYLGVVVLPLAPSVSSAGNAPKKGRPVRRLELRIDAEAEGALKVGVREEGTGEWVIVSVGVDGT